MIKPSAQTWVCVDEPMYDTRLYTKEVTYVQFENLKKEPNEEFDGFFQDVNLLEGA